MHNTYINAFEVLWLTLKFSERGSEGPQYDQKNLKNGSKWEQKWLLRQNYKFLTKVFIITFNQCQKTLLLSYHTCLYHKIDIFIVGVWRHMFFGFRVKKVINIDFWPKWLIWLLISIKKRFIWAITHVCILKLIFLW